MIELDLPFAPEVEEERPGAASPSHSPASWRPAPPSGAREDCTVCQGTGWELLDDDSTASARRCSCSALHRLLTLKDRVQIPQRYAHCTFETFDPVTLSQANALEVATRFARRVSKQGRGLLLTGPAGVGKTHLAAAIAQELVERFQDDVLFADFATLIRLPLECGDRLAAWRRALEVEVLVLDDLRLEEAAPESIGIIEELLEARIRPHRVGVYTGDFGCTRGLADRASRAGRGARGAPRGLPPHLSWLGTLAPRIRTRWLRSLRTVPVHGPDLRKTSTGDDGLF
jgi:DNA replication protein DnaC